MWFKGGPSYVCGGLRARDNFWKNHIYIYIFWEIDRKYDIINSVLIKKYKNAFEQLIEDRDITL